MLNPISCAFLVVFCNKISSIQGGEKFWKLRMRCFSCFKEAHKTNQAQQQTIQNLTTEIQLLNEKGQLFNQQIIWTL